MKISCNSSGIIIYWSKYGCTKQYARWLHEKTGFKICAMSAPFAPSLKKAGVIIAGSSIRSGKLKIASWIRTHWKDLKDKLVIVYSTSALSPEDSTLQEIWHKSLPSEIRMSCEYFPMPGRLIYSRLTILDKIKLWSDAMTSGDPEVEQGLKKGFNSMDIAALSPILERVKIHTAKPGKKS